MEQLGRIDRERDFHNSRFGEENRRAQSKYYSALQEAERKYADLVVSSCQGKIALEYGCAKGQRALELASICTEVHGIDISDVAISEAVADSVDLGVQNAHFQVMNAECMSFEDGKFDVVFGSGIIHHLDTERAFREIGRVLKPGGRAIFLEPLGANVAINLYRHFTPSVRTPDEHPLVRADYMIADRYFSERSLLFYGLFTLAAVPFLGTSAFRFVYSVTKKVDDIIFHVPGFKWQAWMCLSIFSK